MLKIETGDKNKVLRKIAKKIEQKDFSKTIKLGKEMMKYIKNPKNLGVGLAAPQIGHSIRLIVVSLLRDREDDRFKTIIMINPEILEHSEETNFEKEGCLSVPGKKGEVKRFNSIKVKFIDEKKQEKIINLDLVSARIVQHEIDHLNGILFTDYLTKSGENIINK